MKKEDRELLELIEIIQDELNEYAEDIYTQSNEDTMDELFDLRKQMVLSAIDVIDSRISRGLIGQYQHESWLREFATITISVGRQTGSTYFLHNIDTVLPNKKVCIIFPTSKMLKTFRQNEGGHTSNYTTTVNELYMLTHLSYDYVAIDCGNHLTKEEMDIVYDFAYISGAKAIINVF